MDANDVKMISDLAESIRAASPVEKERAASDLIDHLIASQPDALYFLVQTVLVQKAALEAQHRPGFSPTAPVADRQPSRGGFAGIFGGRRQEHASPQVQPSGMGGGSFLKTAAVGAAGAAGGLLLAQGISDVFSGPAESGHGDAANHESDWSWGEEA